MTIPEAAGVPGASRGGRGLQRHTAPMNYVLPHVSSNASTGKSRYRFWSIQNMNKWTAAMFIWRVLYRLTKKKNSSIYLG